jgi:hypothetical protein
LENNNFITVPLIPKILETHKYLTDVFEENTGMQKRSLASKYLHFHARELFFLYDSIAVSAIGTIVKKVKLSSYDIDEREYDAGYAQFYIKLFWLQNHIKEKFNIDMTPREIDRMLRNY